MYNRIFCMTIIFLILVPTSFASAQVGIARGKGGPVSASVILGVNITDIDRALMGISGRLDATDPGAQALIEACQGKSLAQCYWTLKKTDNDWIQTKEGTLARP